MTAESVRDIQTVDAVDAEVNLPPSKSYTNRALIVASLADGTSMLAHPSRSDDSRILTEALLEFGAAIEMHDDYLIVRGTGGILKPLPKTLYLGNAGTAMRFLSSLAALAPGITILDGDAQMQHRPIGDLLDALRASGVEASSVGGYPPVTISGGHFDGGTIAIEGSISSQFISSLLLCAPYAKHDVILCIRGRPSSLPYVDMSLHVMRSFGGEVSYGSPSTLHVKAGQRYLGRSFVIESDASAATYFFAAAAITRGRVTVRSLSANSLQGDIRFLDILSEMGCTITRSQRAIVVQGTSLHGMQIDMNSLPDAVPALAVVAAFGESPTTLTNIGHLRYKETDRLAALATELARIGAEVEVTRDAMTVRPRHLNGARITTYNDHRIAMSFAVAGLRIKGIEITNPTCVSKSFPSFWDEFSKLESKE